MNTIDNQEWVDGVLAIFNPGAVTGQEQTIIVVELDDIDLDQEC